MTAPTEPTLFDLTYTRFDVHGRLHREKGGTPFGCYDTFDEAFQRYKQVLAKEYPTGGMVTVTEIVMDAYSHVALTSNVVHEGRR